MCIGYCKCVYDIVNVCVCKCVCIYPVYNPTGDQLNQNLWGMGPRHEYFLKALQEMIPLCTGLKPMVKFKGIMENQKGGGLQSESGGIPTVKGKLGRKPAMETLLWAKILSLWCPTFLWLRWVFIAARRLSLVAASGGYSLLRCVGLSLRWLLVVEHGL